MTNTFTLAELQALPNADLNALAAELRGYRNDPSNAAWYDEHGGRFDYEYEFTPATDRNKSGELLMWAAAQGAEFEIQFRATPKIFFLHTHMKANDARAETIAFCAAMLAMAGRLQ